MELLSTALILLRVCAAGKLLAALGSLKSLALGHPTSTSQLLKDKAFTSSRQLHRC